LPAHRHDDWIDGLVEIEVAGIYVCMYVCKCLPLDHFCSDSLAGSGVRLGQKLCVAPRMRISDGFSVAGMRGRCTAVGEEHDCVVMHTSGQRWRHGCLFTHSTAYFEAGCRLQTAASRIISRFCGSISPILLLLCVVAIKGGDDGVAARSGRPGTSRCGRLLRPPMSWQNSMVRG
jgi:hypothetical protein